jgi:putative ABC transport system permease protein
VVRLHPLDRKLARDLWRLRGQVLAIGLVIASGVAVLVMSLSALEALRETGSAYYERYRFAHVFAHVERAPLTLLPRLRAIPGVQTVELRVVRSAVLDVPGFAEPIVGQLVSTPEGGEPLLNRIALRAGRLPRLGAPDEVVLSEPLAEAHALRLGGTLGAVVNGRRRELRIVGIGLSPEYVYTIGPGALMPDERRFGVVWMGADALRAAFDLEGAFDDVALLLLRGADSAAVIAQLDRLLARYGGIGAYGREDQLSNWFLMNELEQLAAIARILPTIFLAVAAFLTHMVLARLIAVERAEIGLLKAFGYRSRDVAWHYAKLVLAIGAVGVGLGSVLGYALGLYNTTMYADFFRFPFLLYQPSPWAFAVGGLASICAALLGAMQAVFAAAALPPAEAMRPPAPPQFHRSRFAQGRSAARIDRLTRIVLRQALRWPVRSLLTSVGIGLAIGVMVTALQWTDAIDTLAEVALQQAQTQDVTVGFPAVRSSEIARDVARLPGVLAAEPMRLVAAKLHAGARERREAIIGVPARQELYRVFDAHSGALALPPGGLVLSTALAERLRVERGDELVVEVLEGRRPLLRVPVVALFETYLGTPAFMEIGALGRALRERPSVNALQLRVDSRELPALFRELKEIPMISAVTLRSAAIDTLHETMGRTVLIFVSFFVVFSCTLAFGVTYNAARVAFSERARELATLRVLGFSEAEISYLLLGETALLTLVALPIGCGAGYGLTRLIARAFETELYRIPVVLEPATYGFAIVVGLAATAASALIVRRRAHRLDLIAVLKSRE